MNLRRASARFGMATAVALLLLRLAAIFVDVDPALATDKPMLGPSAAHWLGTDQLGRDIALRMVDGVEAFFLPGIACALVALGLGVPAGAAMGYRPQGRTAAVLRFVLAIVGAWPRLVVVIVGVSIFTASLSDPAAWGGVRLYLLAGLLGLGFLPQVAAAVEEKVRSFRREHFVEAAVAHGLSHPRILGYHLLWANCRNVVLRQACTAFGAFLLVETSLSYLGDYGVPPPRPSWGNILAGVRAQVVHVRSLLRPEAWTPAEVLAGFERAVFDGGALALLGPTLAIIVSIAGIVALADSFQEEER